MKLQTLKPAIRTLDLRTARPAPKTAKPFYLSPEWRSLMNRIIAKRGRRCEKCGRTGCRIFGDHITELQDGGDALDESNIMLLCGSCHTTKTVEARAARMKG